MPEFTLSGKVAAVNAIMRGFCDAIQMLFAKKVYRRPRASHLPKATSSRSSRSRRRSTGSQASGNVRENFSADAPVEAFDGASALVSTPSLSLPRLPLATRTNLLSRSIRAESGQSEKDHRTRGNH
jgi:hypothetical protein